MIDEKTLKGFVSYNLLTWGLQVNQSDVLIIMLHYYAGSFYIIIYHFMQNCPYANFSKLLRLHVYLEVDLFSELAVLPVDLNCRLIST